MTFMLAFCLALPSLQSIEPDPPQGAIGDAVSVRVVDAEGERKAGVPVELRLPDGTTRTIGSTAADGTVTFEVEFAGRHALRAPLGSVELIAPFQGVERPWLSLARWLGVPAGLALVVWNARGLRRRRSGT